MNSNTFWTLIYISVFFIVVGHVFLTGLMGEPILRVRGGAPSTESGKLHHSKDDLLDYVKSHLVDIDNNKYEFRPKGSNFYSDTHDSDIHHDKTDLSKYFEIEQSVPDTKQLLKEITCDPVSQVTDCKQVIGALRDNQTGNPMYFDHGSDGTPTYKPDLWRYENEKVMNGGFIDGLRGNDHSQSEWAVYPPAADVKKANFLSSYPYIQSAGMW